MLKIIIRGKHRIFDNNLINQELTIKKSLNQISRIVR